MKTDSINKKTHVVQKDYDHPKHRERFEYKKGGTLGDPYLMLRYIKRRIHRLIKSWSSIASLSADFSRSHSSASPIPGLARPSKGTSVCISWCPRRAVTHAVYPTNNPLVNAVAMRDAVIIVIKSSWSTYIRNERRYVPLVGGGEKRKVYEAGGGPLDRSSLSVGDDGPLWVSAFRTRLSLELLRMTRPSWSIATWT